MSGLSRRRFLQNSIALAGGSLALSGCRSPQPIAAPPRRVLGANDRVRIAMAGIRARGGEHINSYTQMTDVEIAYLVDPDSRLFAGVAKRIEDKTSRTPVAVQDIRRALDDKSIDAVSIATPNHWHTLMSVWACQAGKDVYVEKPLSHNVHEGRVLTEAARRYGRIVQHGTQGRSDPRWMRSLTALRAGTFGRLLLARALCYKPRGSIGFKSNAAPPPELDFNLWLGPAPEQPYHENLVHYNWHWFWDTGNGDIGNQGVHQMDIALWGLGDEKLPRTAVCLGGRFGYEDQGQTPNTQLALFEFDTAPLLFEVRGLKTERYRGVGVGNIFHCEAGDLVDGKWFPKGAEKPEPLPEVEIQPGPGGGNHFRNFIEAVRAGKPSDLNAPALKGHYSSALCHLANVSYRLGEMVPFNRKTKAFGEHKEAYETLARMEEHLGDNAVKIEEAQYRLGRRLVLTDERAQGDAEANRLITGAGQYRGQFTVPERIG